MCQTEHGCPIQELAEDVELTRLCNGFIDYKTATNNNAPEPLRLEALTSSGIMELGYTLLNEFEKVFSEFIISKREEAQEEAEHQRRVERAKEAARNMRI